MSMSERLDDDGDDASTVAPPDDAKTAEVTCFSCRAKAKWKRMVKKWDPEDHEYYYVCATCVMTQMQLPDLKSAQLHIIQVSPGFKRKSEQQSRWQQAKKCVKVDFEMMSGSRKQIRTLTLAAMKTLFSPMADAIVRKHRHMELLNSDLDMHKSMIQRMKTCTDPTECQEMLTELDNLLDSPLLGFEGKKDQWQFQLASTYSDEYVSDSKSGSYMRFFFMCLSGHADTPCMTIQQSKEWKTKSGDPLWPKGWTCPCGTTYRTKYGVIVEIVAPGIDGILYCRAPVPDEHVNDMRAMMHEDVLKPATPLALYGAVPECKPSSTSMIVKKERDMYGNKCDNQWTFSSKKDYEKLPKFDWYQVFNLAGKVLPPHPLTKKQKKEKARQLWEAEQVVGAK
jgi:hypothetical protein